MAPATFERLGWGRGGGPTRPFIFHNLFDKQGFFNLWSKILLTVTVIMFHNLHILGKKEAAFLW